MQGPALEAAETTLVSGTIRKQLAGYMAQQLVIRPHPTISGIKRSKLQETMKPRK
jgi:hypothetical protein